MNYRGAAFIDILAQMQVTVCCLPEKFLDGNFIVVNIWNSFHCRKENIEWLVYYAQSKYGVMPQRIAVAAIFVAGSDLMDVLFGDVVQGVGTLPSIRFATQGERTYSEPALECLNRGGDP